MCPSSRPRTRALAGGLAVVAAALVAGSPSAQEGRRPLPVPDIPGFVTIKADFHLHSVFSDGEVWPTVHVREAWRDGLDAIALTEHIEYRPHAADVAGDARRAFEVARPLAERLGVLLVPGVEITRPAPGARSDWPAGSAHFNALFVTDVAALDTPDLTEVMRRAKAQGAFTFWNHPGFMDRPARWFPHVAALVGAGLVGGIEVVNGDRFYPEALEWSAVHGLTVLATSDAHLPMPAHLRSARRPVTLVFARTRDPEGIREALVARRTLAWLDSEVWGPAPLLTSLWTVSVAAGPARAAAGAALTLALENRSAIDFEIEVVGTPPWLTLEDATVARETTTAVAGRVAADAPPGTHAAAVQVRVRNLQAAAGTPIVVPLAVGITVDTRP